jgi:hypothetical protein
MATYIDSAILAIDSPGNLILTLSCGYGQPVITSVYRKNIDGISQKIFEFEGNTDSLVIGTSEEFKYNRLEIHSTIHDINDFSPGQEAEDINLSIKLSCNNKFVEMDLIKKTKGKGQLINCIYEVTIL